MAFRFVSLAGLPALTGIDPVSSLDNLNGSVHLIAIVH